MKVTYFLLFLLIIFNLNVSKGLKILGIFPLGAGSHYILGSALMHGLAEKGHEVTIISVVEDKNPPNNTVYRQIVLKGTNPLEADDRLRNFNLFELKTNFVEEVIMTEFVGRFVTELTLKNVELQKLLNSKEKFDIFITEQFSTEALKMVGPHFNASIIVLSTVGANLWVNRWVANPAPYSYVPDLLSTFLPKMNFWQRLQNTFCSTFNHLFLNFYSLPKHRELAKRYFPNGPNLDEVLYNTSLILLNSHPAINQPVPHVPNMVEIGGFHIKTPKKLPKDLQDFLDDAKEGVIYFSMGSNLKSTDLPKNIKMAFINNFRKLKQKVLWKFEDDSLPNQPKNLKIIKWAPQQDILAHPNVKLFITHGGLLSITETIYHGVPILALPVFGDQTVNALMVEYNGYGLSLSFKEINEQNLNEKINELLNNDKYKKVAKFRSNLFHDQETKPLDRAIYWIEYVGRHKGASHLMVEGVNLPFYKYLLLDVIAFCLISLFVFYKLIGFLCKIMFCRGKQNVKQKTN